MTKWISGVNNQGFGIIFTSNLPEKICEFLICAGGQYQITSTENNGGTWEYLVPWTVSDFVNKDNAPNLLLLSKQGNYLNFYINDHLVQTLPFDGGFGAHFGFCVIKPQTVEFHNLDLKGTKM